MNASISEQPLLLSLEEAAKLLSVSRRTLERLISQGRFPKPVKIAGCTRVSFSALQEYVGSLLAPQP